MGYFNVVAPCVVGKLHYAQPTTQPVEVDDDVAAPLVESGCLQRYTTGTAPVEEFAPGTFLGVSEPGDHEVDVDDEPPTDPPPPRRRGRRSEG